jgi:hypothetical protein
LFPAIFEQPLLDFGAKRPGFGFDLGQAFEECVKLLWCQAGHGERRYSTSPCTKLDRRAVRQLFTERILPNYNGLAGP